MLMFTATRLNPEQPFPLLPTGHPDWQPLMEAADVHIDPAGDDILKQLTRYAIGWVEGDPKYTRPWHSEPLESSSRLHVFRNVGLVDAIMPPTADTQYATVVDGGTLQRYQRRLEHLTAMEQTGQIATSRIVIFGGQALRSEGNDPWPKLTKLGRSLQETADKNSTAWLTAELNKDPFDPNQWHRPFATERELGRLALVERYGQQLCHKRTMLRPEAHSIAPEIPVADEAADIFSKESGQQIMLLNAPAKYREHAGRVKYDLAEARPTGRSCFREWLEIDQPPIGSAVMLATSAPNIYRSWCDLLLVSAEAGRGDLRLTGTGAGVSEGRTVGHVLRGLGDIIMNTYNYVYEGGVDSPNCKPFEI